MEVPTDALVDATTTVFVLSTMLSMGLELSPDQLLAPLRERGLVARSLAVNVAVVPLLAYVSIRLLPLEPAHAAGVVLIAVSPGAPFGPKLAEISDSDVAFASSIMAVLAVVSVATIPATLALLLPSGVAVDPIAVGRLVFAAQLVPLVAGLALASARPRLAARLRSPVQRLSDYSFGFLVVLLFVVYVGDMVALAGTGTLSVSVAVVAASLLLGYGLGGPARATREVLATTTAARNAAIALFVATTSFADPAVLTVVLAFSFVGVVASILVAGAWRQRHGSAATVAEAE